MSNLPQQPQKSQVSAVSAQIKELLKKDPIPTSQVKKLLLNLRKLSSYRMKKFG